MAPATDRQLVGRTLGGFVLREEIGEGGFGVVYRAEQPALAREAVVKVLKGVHVADPTIVARFVREAQLASRLDHPYAAHIYEFGAETDGLFWLAMELVRGTALDQLLGAQGRLLPERFIPLLDRICEVVHTAHEQGMVHRDLKPANVMVLTRAGRLLPKLLDFGIAKLVESTRQPPGATPRDASATPVERGGDASADTQAVGMDGQGATKAGAVLGSPPYMAPELWDADEIDGRTDQYALAVLTYQALTGALPFTQTGAELGRAHRQAPFPPLGHGFPRALDAALARGAAKLPRDRFPDVLAFAAAVRAAAGLDPGAEARPELPQAIRALVLDRTPEPIAQAGAALERARDAREACDLVWALRRTVVRWLGVVALASLPPAPAAVRLVGMLLQRELEDTEWLELARALARAAGPGGPLPELVAMLAGDATAPLAALVALRRGEADEDSRALLGLAMPLVAAALAPFERLAGYRLVVPRADCLEEWTGTKRLLIEGTLGESTLDVFEATDELEPPARPGETTLDLRPRAELDARPHPALADAAGSPLAMLWPLAQVAPPTAGAPDALFLLAGASRRAALLVAQPGGFAIRDDDALSWLVRRYPEAAELADRGLALEPRAYVGLAPFTAADASLFFGREREVEACINRLRVQPLLVIAGPSGAGKSSFVHAGLVPALPTGWRAVSLRPGHAPMATLAARLAPALGHRDPTVLAAGLARDPGSIQAFLASAAGGPLVLIIDQLEELFTLCPDPAARAAFAEALAGAVSFAGSVRVVCTVRDDFLVRVEALPALRQRCAQALHILTTPGADELRRILEEPARRAGYAFDDPALPAEMVRAVADRPGALALLSFTAARLWDARDRARRLLLTGSYRAMGGVAGALGQHADETLARMPADERRLVREAFRHLVTPEGTRAPLTRAELEQLLGDDDRARAVIEALTSARLLSIADAEGGETIEVAHEALLEAWPRAVAWRHEDAEGARRHAELRAAARRWEARGRPRHMLLADEDLTEMRRWHALQGGRLTQSEAAFVAASLGAAQRGRRLRTAALAGAIAALAVLTTVLYRLYDQARVQSRLAEERSAVAEARRDELVLLQARSLVDRDPTAALAWLKLYARTGEAWHDVQAIAVDAWSRGVARRVLRGHDRAVWELAFSPDGKTLASASFDHTIRLWDLDGKGSRVLAGHTGEVNDLSFARDGKTLASASDDGTVRIWSLADGTSRALTGHRGIVASVEILARGDRAVSGGGDGSIRLWDLATGGAVSVTEGEAGAIRKLAVSPDDALVASGGEGPDVWLWDLATLAPRRLQGHAHRVTSVAFSADGKRLASVDSDGELRVWEAPGWTGRTLGAQAGGVRTLAFAPDGNRLAAAGYDETATLWDLGGGKRVLRGHQGPVYGVAFSPDGKQLASGGADRRIRIWDVPADPPAFGGFTMGQGEGLVFSPDGGALAYTAGGAVRVVDVAGGRTHDLQGGSRWQRSAIFSPDGQRVAALDDEGWVRVWPRAGGAPAEMRGRSGAEIGLAFGSDGESVLFPVGPAVMVWRPGEGEPRALGGPHDVVRWLRALPGQVAAVAGNELWVWDLAAGTGRRLGAGRSYIAGFEVAPDGKTLAIGDHDGSIQLWDDGGASRGLLTGHTATVVPLAFSADGRVVVSGGNDKTVRVWRDGARRPIVLEGHRTLVRRVVVAPDASFVASSGNDDTIRTWDLRDGSSGAFVGHAGAVSYLALSPGAALLASAGADGEVRLWDTSRRAHVPGDGPGLRRWLDEATSAQVEDVQP